MLYNNFKLVASVAAEINRGGGRKTWLCQMWKNPTFIGAGVKKFDNATIPHFTSSQWRHKTPLIPTEINKKTKQLPNATGHWQYLVPTVRVYVKKSRETSLPYSTFKVDTKHELTKPKHNVDESHAFQIYSRDGTHASHIKHSLGGVYDNVWFGLKFHYIDMVSDPSNTVWHCQTPIHVYRGTTRCVRHLFRHDTSVSLTSLIGTMTVRKWNTQEKSLGLENAVVYLSQPSRSVDDQTELWNVTKARLLFPQLGALWRALLTCSLLPDHFQYSSTSYI